MTHAIWCHRWSCLWGLWWALVCRCPWLLSLDCIWPGHVCCPHPLRHWLCLSSCIAAQCVHSLCSPIVAQHIFYLLCSKYEFRHPAELGRVSSSEHFLLYRLVEGLYELHSQHVTVWCFHHTSCKLVQSDQEILNSTVTLLGSVELH